MFTNNQERLDFYSISARGLLADIDPNNELDDNDPRLNDQMQMVFNRYYLDYKLRGRRKDFTQKIELAERKINLLRREKGEQPIDVFITFNGSEYTIERVIENKVIKRSEGCLRIPENNYFKQDCIDEIRLKLIRFDILTLPSWQRIKLKKMLTFLLRMEELIKHKSHESTEEKPIIKSEHIGLIFDKFIAEWFLEESKEQWISRFYYPNGEPVSPMPFLREAREGSNKLVLIAILAAVQETISNTINFQKFAQQRFGLKSYDKTKNDHKNKVTYLATIKECHAILKK